MLAAAARTVMLGLILVAPAGAVEGATTQPGAGHGTWLTDLARDAGVAARGNPQPADLLHVEALLRAAVRLDPQAVDAWRALYELAEFRGDTGAVRAALERLLVIQPDHATAAARWLALRLTDEQTLERRERVLVELVGDEQRAPLLKALACVQLARLAHAQVEPTRSAEWLERARALVPDLPAIHAARLELLPGDAPLHERAAAGLALLRVNPLAVDAAWEVGVACHEAGVYDSADEFYEYALQVHRATAGDALPPIEQLLDLAMNQAALERWEAALATARRAAAAAPERVDAALLVWWLCRRTDDTDGAAAVAKALGDRFARVAEPDDWPVSELASAAWYHSAVELQPHRALALAQAAAQRAPQDRRVQRVLGWAQATNQDWAAALETLTPLAQRDAFAAYQCARAALATGDAAAADRVLAEWQGRPLVGPARELLEELWQQRGTPAPTTQAAASDEGQRLRTLLSGFDRGVFDFARDPAALIAAEVRLDRPTMSPGDRWWAEFIVTNRSRLPLSLGPDGALNPMFLVSLRMEGDRARAYPHLLTVTLDGAAVLPPGATLRVRRTLDIGPPARASAQTPQQLQQITLSAMLDPAQRADGVWVPGPAGRVLPDVIFTRRPAATGEAAIAELLAAAGGADSAAATPALHVVAQLLGEQQRGEAGRIGYRVPRLAADRLTETLAAALHHADWQRRAATLDALQSAGLDATLYAAAERCLGDEHWLVRMMALRLLARQGDRMLERAKAIAADDPDELVRLLARSYVVRWTRFAPATPTAP